MLWNIQNVSCLLMKQGNVPSELPPWMKFLHTKLGNPATPLNIRLFISKLIINTEEVNIITLFLLVSSICSQIESLLLIFCRSSDRTPSTGWGRCCRSLSPGTTEERGSISWWWMSSSQCSPGQAWPAPRLLKTNIYAFNTFCIYLQEFNILKNSTI